MSSVIAAAGIANSGDVVPEAGGHLGDVLLGDEHRPHLVRRGEQRLDRERPLEGEDAPVALDLHAPGRLAEVAVVGQPRVVEVVDALHRHGAMRRTTRTRHRPDRAGSGR